MTHQSFSAIDDERVGDGHHPSRPTVRVLLLAIIVALMLLTIAGPDSVDYTMARSTSPVNAASIV